MFYWVFSINDFDGCSFYVKTSQPPLGNKSITLSNHLLIACFVE